MKPLLRYTLLFLLPAYQACTGLVDNSDSFSGVYVTEYQHKYARGKDTVFIKQFGARSYRIDRHTAFQRIRDGRPLLVEYSNRHYQGVYREGSGTVLETTGGAILSLNERGDRLLWATQEYARIK